MNLEKIQVRQDLKRMVLNYVLMGKITEDHADRITIFIDNVIGGGELGEVTPSGAKVYNFPGTWQGKEQPEYQPPPKPQKETKVFRVMPDEPFPEIGESDFRKTLRRDGLILHGWERWKDFKYVECGVRKYLGNAYRVHWIASAGKHFHYQSGIVLEEEIYNAMPFGRGNNWGSITTNKPFRQGTGELLQDAEDPDNIVYTLPYGMKSSEIGDYIEKYKDRGISGNLDAVYRLKNQKEQA
jgi:hypothetical protein